VSGLALALLVSIDVLFVGLLVWHGSRWWTPRVLAVSACLGAVSLGVGSLELGVGFALVGMIAPLVLLWPLTIARMVLESARQTRASDQILQPALTPTSNTPKPSPDIVGTGTAAGVAVTCIILTAAGFAGSPAFEDSARILVALAVASTAALIIFQRLPGR
jgi:hypothetical protein